MRQAKRQKRSEQKEVANLLILTEVLAIIMSISVIVSGIIEKVQIFIGLGIIGGIICIAFLGKVRKQYITANRENKRFLSRITKKEKEMIDEAILLIKEVKPDVNIAEFTVYNVKAGYNSWSNNDREKGELSVFMPFKKCMKMNEDLAFLMLLSSILYVQNSRNDNPYFRQDFHDELNTECVFWLIEHSSKYKLPNRINVLGKDIQIESKMCRNQKKVQTVQKILNSSGKEMSELCFNYIQGRNEFFDFVPNQYLLNKK